jgi:hypothetical protein
MVFRREILLQGAFGDRPGEVLDAAIPDIEQDTSLPRLTYLWQLPGRSHRACVGWEQVPMSRT